MACLTIFMLRFTHQAGAQAEEGGGDGGGVREGGNRGQEVFGRQMHL